MDNRKFLVTLFDENGGDYEIIVCGSKSAKNFIDFIFDTKCEAMIRPLEQENKYSPMPEIEDEMNKFFSGFGVK